MPSPRYWELLYRGASLPQSSTSDIGGILGQQRGPLLATLVNQGKLKVQDLSPEDTKAASSNLAEAALGGIGGGIGGALGLAGGFFGNLGGDIVEETKGFAPGVYKTGAAIAHDVTHPMDWGSGTLIPVQRGKEGRVASEIVQPTVDQYKYTYGGVGAPEGSSLLGRIYQHPLGPILDAFTVASLGTGGTTRAASALSNAGKLSAENPLVRMGSTQGRAPLITDPGADPGVVAPEIPRYYSSRPLHKGLQMGIDVLGRAPTGRFRNPVNRMQQWQARNYGLKMGSARKDSEALQHVNQQARQMIPLLRDMSPEEFQAFDLVTRGINTPEWLQEYEAAVGRSMANDLPEGANAKDYGKLAPAGLAASRASLPEATKNLAVNPAQSPALMSALSHYYNLVDERIGADLPEEQRTAKANELRDALISIRREGEEPPEAPPAPEFPPPPVPRGGSPNLPREPEPVAPRPEGPTLEEPKGKGAPSAVESVIGPMHGPEPDPIPPGQRAALSGSDYRRTALEYAKNPEPGAVIWRAEQRDPTDLEAGLSEGGVGIHWTVNPDAVIHTSPEGGKTTVIYQAVLDDPENQIVPRTHNMWQGQSRSMDSEAEVRTKPGAKVRITGAWVWRGEGHSKGFYPPNNVIDPNWEFVPLEGRATSRVGGHINYDRFPDLDPALAQLYKDPELSGVAWEDLHRYDRNKILKARDEEGIYVDDIIAGENPDIPPGIEPKWQEIFQKGQAKEQIGKYGLRTPQPTGNLWERLSQMSPDTELQAEKDATLKSLGQLEETLRLMLGDPETKPTELDVEKGKALDELGKLEEMLRAMMGEGKEPDQPNNAPPTAPPVETTQGPEHPFPEPTIAPSQFAKNFEWHEPTRLGRLFGQEEGWRRRQGQFNPSNVTYQNVLQEPFNTYRPNANPLLAGLHRPDPRQYVDLIAKHERDLVDQAYSAKLLDKWSLKDNEGEPLTVLSDEEAQRKYGPQYTAVHPTAPLHYYNDQTTVADMVSYMEQNGFPVDGPEMKAAIESLGEDTVMKMTQAARKQKAYVIPRAVAEYQRKIENASKPYENVGLRMLAKPLNVWRQYTLSLMPRWALNTAVGSFVLNAIKGVGPRDYLMAQRLRKGTTTLEHSGPTAEDIWLHGTQADRAQVAQQGLRPPGPGESRWEAGGMTHPYEPGVYMAPSQNVAGMFGPTIFGVDTRGMNLFEDLNSDPGMSLYSKEAIPPEKIKDLGTLFEWGDQGLSDDIRFKAEPFREWAASRFPDEVTEVKQPSVFEHTNMGGVELGNVIGMEMQELAHQAGMGTNRVAQRSMRGVQAIEDFFRRASMVHSLSQEAKQAIRENGTILKDFELGRGPRTVDEYRDLVLNNPELVKRALEDVDKFSYNFASLGPFERRALRQIAPFWGWYRFISGVAYRLPIDYPGRTNVMAQIGQMGMNSNEEEFGGMPSWLKGNILFNTAGPGISYLGTAGINPFSQIFNPTQMMNPVSPEGLAGVAQLGQASPIIQAAMAGYGIDPMSGRSLDVSPESGVSPDLQGQLREETTGEEKNLAAVEPMQRILATLIRAFPEARIGERFRGGGLAPYPESIPVVHERYRATKPENRYGGTLQEMLAQMFGVAVRPFQLERYQGARNRGRRAAMRKGQRERARIKQARKK